MFAPVILSVVAFIAGHPTQVLCDADTNPSPLPPPTGYVVNAWTVVGAGPIHMTPGLCDATNAPVSSLRFATALRVVIREAAVAGKAKSEACAEMVADVGVFEVLRRFYHVSYFTPLSELIGKRVRQATRRAPPNQQPELCWQMGTIG